MREELLDDHWRKLTDTCASCRNDRLILTVYFRDPMKKTTGLLCPGCHSKIPSPQQHRVYFNIGTIGSLDFLVPDSL